MKKVMQNAYLTKSGIEYEALSLTLFCWQVFDSLFNSDIASIFNFIINYMENNLVLEAI